MTDNNQQDFLAALDQHWDDYRKQFKAGRKEVSEESIHDLRVSARRFLALLGILRALDAHARVKKMSRFLKKQLNQLDELHDAQVMLADTTQTLEKLPPLAPFKTYLDKRAKDLARTARKRIKASRPSDLKPRIKKIHKVAKKHGDDGQLPNYLLQIVDGAYSNVLQRFEKLSASDPATIHRVRIAFKKLRYMIETIHPFLKDYPEVNLERMHGYQEAMGRVHDAMLLLDRLQSFETSLPKDEAQALDARQIEAHYQQRLDGLIRAYFECKDEFHTFWRPAPDQPFPWEKSHDSLRRTSRNRRTTGDHQQRGGGQPAAANRRGPQEDAQDRTRAEGDGSAARPDPDQPIHPGS